MLSNILERISFWSLFLVIVLLPVFFLPFTKIPVETSKGLLLVAGLTVSIIFWIAARFSDGKITVPKSWLLLSGLGIVLAFLLSALFSSTPNLSLFGIMLDTGTFYFMLGAFLLMFLSSIMLKDIKNAKTVFWGVIISSLVLFVFQALRLFFPAPLSFSVLGGSTDNLIGSWNSLGLFAGFSTIISLFIAEFFSTSKKMKWLLGALVVLSLIVTAVVNFSLVWIILGVSSLVIFVYKISLSLGNKQEGDQQKKEFPGFSFAVVMVSLLFFISSPVGSFLPGLFGIENIEIRPSFTSTMAITGSELARDPIFGIGPNKFSEAWALFKDKDINSTIFWDTSFNSGSGLIPTFAVTTGGLGILALLLFFGLFIKEGLKSLFTSIKNNTNWEVVIFFVAAFYLFVSAFFYATSGILLLLAFAFTGIYIALSSNRENGEYVFSFLDDPRKSFFSILTLVLLMILSAAIGFKYIEKLISVSYFGNTLTAVDLPSAEVSISKALSLHKNDLYYRTYSQVYLNKIDTTISKGADKLTDEDKTSLQQSFDQALLGANQAVAYDGTNYLNYVSLGAIYNTFGVLGVEDAFAKSIDAYKKAEELNPLNPGIKLAIGRLLFADKKTTEAKEYILKSIDLKPDYIEGLIVMSQVEKSLGNNSSAISFAEQAQSYLPNNKDLSQYVNSLKNGSSVPAPSIEDTTEASE